MSAVAAAGTVAGSASGGAGDGGRGRARLVLFAVVGVVLILVVVAVLAPAQRRDGPPLDPRSTTASGTKAATELARGLGADVRIRSEIPGDDVDVAVMFQDLVDDEVADDLDAWVSAGHTLVIADPSSQLAPEGDYQSSDPFADSQSVRRDECDVSEPEGLDRLGELASYGSVVRFEVPGGARSCFADSKGSVVVVQPVGRGQLISVGTPYVFTNEALDHADNAGLFAALAVPTRSTRLDVLVVGEDGSGIQGPREAGDLVLPDGVVLALLQLFVAFVVYCVYRARRLGKPVVEDPTVAIAGSELVWAVGGLLEHAGARDRAAASLRRSARRRLATAFGLPIGADAQAVVATVAARTPLDHDRLAAGLQDGPVADDASLATLGGELDGLVAAALGRSPTVPAGDPTAEAARLTRSEPGETSHLEDRPDPPS